MDRGDALLAALRAKTVLGGASQLMADQVEALGDALAIPATEIPGLIAQLQARTPPVISLVWGGNVQILPVPDFVKSGDVTGGDVNFYITNSNFAEGATIGPNAKGGIVNKGTDTTAAMGVLAAAVLQLAAVRPSLEGNAAALSAQSEQVLRERPAPDAAPEAKNAWAKRANELLSALAQAAPQVLTLTQMACKAVALFI